MNLHPHKRLTAILGYLLLLLPGHGAAEAVPENGPSRPPVPALFSICFNHGCQSQATVELAPKQWQTIRQLFTDGPATSPQKERERIAQALGKLEQLVGALTGTGDDRGGNLAGLWLENQMDCIDESTNTNTYLVMMRNDKLLKHHEPAGTATRILPHLFPHTTAVIREISTDQEYAVDSWFLDNGQPSSVVPLRTWRWGWTPGDKIPEAAEEAAGRTAGSR